MRTEAIVSAATALTAAVTLTACGTQSGSGGKGAGQDAERPARPASSVTGAPHGGVPLTGTRWNVTSLLTGFTGRSSAPVPAGTEGKAHFVLGRDGSVHGSLGCNTFNAEAKQRPGAITFGRLASTRRMCPGPESALEQEVAKVLAGEVGYDLKHRSLFLTAPNGRGLVATAEG